MPAPATRSAGPIAVAPPPSGGWGPWLRGVYDRLLAHFGYQHWWPAETAFEVIVGAYLTQNIAWSNVDRAIRALRGAGLLEPAALHAAPPEVVEALIRPTGYFRQKTRRLKAFLDHLFTRYGGDLQALLGRPADELRAELLALQGVGPETADSILCYAAGRAVMVVDAYTRRTFHRLGAFTGPDTPYDAMQAFFHAHLPRDRVLLGDFHAQIVALGKAVCVSQRPRCEACPLADVCASARERQAAAGGGTRWDL